MAIILRLDRVMADRKMSLKELSEKVGVANVNLSKIKRGTAPVDYSSAFAAPFLKYKLITQIYPPPQKSLRTDGIGNFLVPPYSPVTVPVYFPLPVTVTTIDVPTGTISLSATALPLSL